MRKKIISDFLLSKGVNREGEIDTGDNTVSAVYILLRLISSTYPLILTFDNIEHADSQTRKFMEDISALENKKYLIIIITESEDFYIKNAISVTTSQLTFKDIESLFRKLTGKKPHSSLVEYIAKRSSRNLRMVSEMIKLLDESGALVEQSGYLVIKEGAYELPDSINHVLLARYNALPIEMKEFLKYASIMGIRFSPQIISSAFFKGQKLQNTLLYLRDLP